MRTLLPFLGIVALLGTCWAVPAGKIIFISGGQLYSMLPDGSKLTKLTATGAAEPVASPNGKVVAFFGKGGISLYNVASSTLTTLPVEGPLHALHGFSPDNNRIYFSRNSYTGECPLFSIGITGRDERQATDLEATFAPGSTVSRDGQSCVSIDENKVVLTSVDGKEEQSTIEKVLGEYDGIDEVIISPDGKSILMVLGSTGDYFHGELYIIQADGKNLKRIVRIQDGKPDSIDSAVAPSFSPDGKWVVFTGWSMWGPDPDTETQAYLYIVKADGSGRRRIAKLTGDYSNHAFSPDGKTLAFVNGGDIWTINVDGTGLRQLTKRHHNDNPVWIP
ncbi:MAG: TolB family protein [Armatimonadota bacterium]